MAGTPQVILTVFLCAFTLVAFALDIRTSKLPNWLTVPAFGAGLLFHSVEGFFRTGLAGATGGLLFALGGFATGFGIVLVLWLVGGSGGGDVKFMGALGSWLGTWLTFQVLVVSAVFAGLFTLSLLAADALGLNPFQPGEKRPKGASGGNKKKTNQGPLRAHWFGGRGVVPFAVPAMLATWCMLALQWAGYGLPWPPSR